jgi:hypothetical protein
VEDALGWSASWHRRTEASTHYDSQRNGLLRMAIIPNDSEETQAHWHYRSYLKATDDPRTIVAGDPSPKRDPQEEASRVLLLRL